MAFYQQPQTPIAQTTPVSDDELSRIAPPPPMPVPQNPPTNKKKILIIAGIILLLVLFIASGSIILFDKKKPTPPPAITLNVFPQNLLPIYPGATATRQVGLPQDGKQGINVALLTGDSSPKIDDFYQKFFKENNWQVEANQYGGEDALWELKFKKEAVEGTITITRWPENSKYSEIVILLTY